uniref:Putative secreted protein n=1 Tax=Ixodes ricinus TaxID=34613 RepID=A0A6B0UPP6_IXORI
MLSFTRILTTSMLATSGAAATSRASCDGAAGAAAEMASATSWATWSVLGNTRPSSRMSGCTSTEPTLGDASSACTVSTRRALPALSLMSAAWARVSSCRDMKRCSSWRSVSHDSSKAHTCFTR